MVVLNRARARAAGVDYTRLADLAAAHLAAQPGIARVWRREELAAHASREPMAALYLHSETPGHEADLLIEPRRSCLLSEFPTGTSHGSPHDYDRRVPLVFLAPGIAPGEIGGRAATVDIAPTLAAWLGLTPPGELDGRVLPLAGE